MQVNETHSTLTDVTVQDIRDAVILGLPLFEAFARRTANKYDDLACVVMRVVATNDEVAKAVEAAIARGEGQKK